MLPAALVGILSIAACHKSGTGIAPAPVSFENTPSAYLLPEEISEASGIADSKINPGYLWVEEDSGNPPQLYLLSHTGKILKKIYLKGAVNRDWEDIALAAGPDAAKHYLYIAEIGDNDGVHTSSAFYRLEEPLAAVDTIRAFERINFTYADGPRDAEAFLVDDATKDIYVITKRDLPARLYKIAWPYSTADMNTAIYVETLPYFGVVSAALSPDGKGIMVKTYPELFYYSRVPGETIAQTLQKDFVKPGYQAEPQGEAVGFAQDNAGFYTLSEKGNASTQSLYFYKKK